LVIKIFRNQKIFLLKKCKIFLSFKMAWHDGEWWPLYVPDWYAPRVSQYFFDPYSFCHILHGFIFYGLWGWWPELVWGYNWWWVWLLGAVLAVLGELVHELIENSEWCIELYRNNSGTSGQYDGDSVQNILGDLMSCLFGWYVTALLHLAGYPWIVVIWTVISEAILIWYMRDCGLLICIQLICPIKAIQAWQAEGIPLVALDPKSEELQPKKNENKSDKPNEEV